jgi:hypothetical protein
MHANAVSCPDRAATLRLALLGVCVATLLTATSAAAVLLLMLCSAAAAAAAAAGDTPHMYRPLFFYVVMEIIELLCWAILACCGFKRYSILVRIVCTL